MPLNHFQVWFIWKGFLGKNLWKWAAALWVGDFKALHRGLQKRNMFFWLEEKLDGFPSNEALRGQCRNGGRHEWVDLGFQRMVASQRLVYERQRRLGGFEEEGVVIAANETVKVSKLGGCQGR